MTERDTKDRIIEAAIELANEQGFRGATTKKIAARAGVNEVTLFRHFGNKTGIVEAANKKYSFDEHLAVVFEKKIVWDVRKDLHMIVKAYQFLLEKKRHLILISLKEAGAFPEFDTVMAQTPLKYKEKLVDYFTEMVQREKLPKLDVEAVVNTFIYLNFGYFLLKSRLRPDAVEIAVNEFITKNIDPFIDAISSVHRT